MKVALIGGGVYVARLCELLAETAVLPSLHLSLVARRADRLQVIAEHARRRIQLHRTDWRVSAHTNVVSAVADASLIVLLIRVGGLRARLYDETFPASFGLPGDEGLGAGGMANAWRTLPVLRSLAETVRRAAPRAQVVNLVAPLGISTRLLLEEGVRAFGLCELPQTTKQKILPDDDHTQQEARLHYAGLNHLGWFWSANVAGEIALSKAVRSRVVDEIVWSEFGAAPLHYYYRIYDPAAGMRIGVSAPRGRARWLMSLDHRIYRRIRRVPGGDAPEYGERPTPWFEHAIIPVMTALLNGTEYQGFADLTVDSPPAWAPREVVIEAAAAIRSGTLRAAAPPAPPQRVADFLAGVAAAEDLTYRAARDRNRRWMKAAARLLPQRLSPARVEELTEAICADLHTCAPDALAFEDIAP